MTTDNDRAIAAKNGDLPMTHDAADTLARRVFYITLGCCVAYALAALILVG